MGRTLSPDTDQRRAQVGGVGPTADILNLLSGGIDQQVLARIRTFDPELADRIVEHMFTFEDLVELEDRALQTLMLEVPQTQLVVALKGASPRLRDKLLKNMAKRAAESVREELETKGPVKVQEVEEEQKAILAIGRTLQDEGRISMQPVTTAVPNNTILKGLFCRKTKKDASNFFPLACTACRSADFSNTGWRGQNNSWRVALKSDKWA